MLCLLSLLCMLSASKASICSPHCSWLETDQVAVSLSYVKVSMGTCCSPDKLWLSIAVLFVCESYTKLRWPPCPAICSACNTFRHSFHCQESLHCQTHTRGNIVEEACRSWKACRRIYRTAFTTSEPTEGACRALASLQGPCLPAGPYAARRRALACLQGPCLPAGPLAAPD